MGGSFKDSPLDVVVYSPHRSGFQEAGDGETKGGDTVQLSFSNLSVCGLICDSRRRGGGAETNIPLRLGGGHAHFSWFRFNRALRESHRIQGNGVLRLTPATAETGQLLSLVERPWASQQLLWPDLARVSSVWLI